ncbi:transporter associated domain-containing protein [Rhodobium gokarnense]|nr:hemolysin family protein [Rhodobium gokarnense]
MNDPDPLPMPSRESDTEPGSQPDSNGDKDLAPEHGTLLDDGIVTRLLGMIGLRNNGTLRDSIEEALTRDEAAEGQFSPVERLLLRNILRLREIRIEDVMVPRADIDAVDEQTPLGSLLRLFRESGHSRMPVYYETLDDPRGIIHIKDLMAYITEATDAGDAENGDNQKTGFDLASLDLGTPLSGTGLVRSVLFVPPSMGALELMAKMQASRMQMALVIDEYGGTDGLVSLEDLVEEVVGEISDEHDEDDDAEIEVAGDGIWVADARLYLDDAIEAIGADFAVEDLAEDVDTLGGLVFTLIGRIPVRGELIASDALPGFEFEVLDADPRRISRLRIYRRRTGEVRRRTRRAEATGQQDA